MVSTVAGFAGKITAVERNPPLALCHRNPRRVPDRRAPKLGLVMYSVVNEAATGEDKSPRLEDLPLPDGDPGLPFIGNALDFQKNGGEEALLRWHEQYGNIYRTSFFGINSVIIWGADNVQELLVGESSRNIKCEMDGPPGELLGPKALTNQPANKHAALRRVLGPFFSPRAGIKYLPFVVERATKCCEECVALGTFSWLKEMKKFAFITVADAVFGIPFPGRSFDEVLELLQTWMDGFFSFGIDLPFTKFGKAMRARKELLAIIQKAVDMAESAAENDDISKKALKQLIDARDEERNGLSREDIGDVMLNLLFAGFETTAKTLSQLVSEFAQHPEVWDKLRAEQQQIVASFGEEITPESLDAMRYADAVMKEVMRLRVLVGGVSRRVTKTFEMGGYRIPEGWGVLVQTGYTTRYMDDRWMNDADELKPERFFQEGATKGAYMPWGLGAHVCIGKVIAELEIKVMLALLARRYVVVLQNPDVDFGQLTLAGGGGDGIPVRLERLPNAVDG